MALQAFTMCDSNWFHANSVVAGSVHTVVCLEVLLFSIMLLKGYELICAAQAAKTAGKNSEMQLLKYFL